MTIKKLDHEWATSGDKTTPSNEKIQEGWVGGDRPTIEYFNWLDNRQDDKINKLVRERFDTFYTDATSPDSMIATGLWDESWGTSDEQTSINYIGTGAGIKYVDIKPYIDSNGDPRLLALDQSTNKIEVWDTRTLTRIVLTDDLTADMVGGDTYYSQSMCTDGTSVYVAFFNDSDDTCEVNAWTINESSSNWTCEWSAETTLSGTKAITGAPTTRAVDLCIADSTKIACITANDTNVTASSDVVITTLLKTTGAIEEQGAGDCPTADNCEGIPRSICSDGTYIYFTAVGATRQYLCSAEIADLTNSNGNWTAAQNLNTAASDSRVCSGGKKLLVGISEAAWTVDEVCLYTATDQEENCEKIKIGQDYDGTPLVGDEYNLSNPSDICFDGMSFWLISDISGSWPGLMLTKIDAAKLHWNTVPDFRYLEYLNPSVFLIAPDEDTWDSNGRHFRRCVFDGRDIWVNVEWQSGEDNTGRIYRLPLAALRS